MIYLIIAMIIIYIFVNNLVKKYIEMKKFIIPVLLLVLTISSCKKDDEEKKEAPAYFAQWSLMQLTKDFYMESYDYGEIIWEFNEYDELIVTVNTDLSNSQLPITTSGVYDYVGADDVVSIQNTQYAAQVQNDTLILSRNAAAGGPLMKFVKISPDDQ